MTSIIVELVPAILALLIDVSRAKEKAKKYESLLTSVESTLKCIEPVVQKLEGIEGAEDHGVEEKKKLQGLIKRGKELVELCSKGKAMCDCFKKSADYREELEDWNNSLKNFYQIELPILQSITQSNIFRKVKETHEDIKEIGEKVKETHEGVKEIGEKVKETEEGVQEIGEKTKGTHESVKEIGKKMNETREGVKEIGEKMKETQLEVQDTGANVKIIQDQVKESREDVKDVGDKVKDAHADVKDVQGKMKELHGDVKRIQEKLESGRISKALNGAASLHPYLPPDPPEHTVGLDEPLRELKKQLLKTGMSVIVLSGPGGCGKTTLAKKLCQEEEVKGKFKENILFVTVSKTPNLKVIVQQIFQHKGHEVPQFQSNEDAINRFGQLLKKIGQEHPILLVLDDVWDTSVSLIDSLKFQIPDYKILVTSRTAFVRFDSIHRLETLDEKDSMSLFRQSACLDDRMAQNIDEDLVIQVMRACKGFPLALNVVGRSLCRQPEAIWQQRLTEWSRGSSIFKTNAELLTCLKSSLDALDDKVTLKESYMDLGSFPEAQLIPATALVDMWVELYGLDEDGTEFIANLHQLSNLNLIDLVITRNDGSEVDGYYTDHFVMQHDLLKELVNHLSSLDPVKQRKRLIVDITENKFPDWWSAQEQQPIISANLFCVSTDENFSSNWFNMQAPEVKVFMLNFRTKDYTLPEFITTMDNLKTLIITNYGFSPAEISNFSLLGNLFNLKRIRLEQVFIPSFSFGTRRLKNMKKIVLHKCSFGQGFDNTMITNVSGALPNLVEINISYSSNLVALPIRLFGILHLKKLSITYCHELSLLPEEIGRLVNLEVLRLSSCANLQELPDTIGGLAKLRILDISDCVSMKKLPEQIGKLQKLRKIYMTGCSTCELPISITNLASLKDVICDEETSRLWNPLKGYFSKLRLKKVLP